MTEVTNFSLLSVIFIHECSLISKVHVQDGGWQMSFTGSCSPTNHTPKKPGPYFYTAGGIRVSVSVISLQWKYFLLHAGDHMDPHVWCLSGFGQDGGLQPRTQTDESVKNSSILIRSQRCTVQQTLSVVRKAKFQVRVQKTWEEQLLSQMRGPRRTGRGQRGKDMRFMALWRQPDLEEPFI